MSDSFVKCFKRELDLIREQRTLLELPVLGNSDDTDRNNWVRSRVEAEEPIVDFSPEDTVGLCLSGGGIRSATFNLGLLQGLNDLKILRLADYVSTVSGGGYIGGWWTAWRSRNAVDPGGSVLPKPVDAFEAKEVRHLREFSRFLVPRVGIFEMETWYGITAFLGGLVPAALTAFALIYFAWWFLSFLTTAILACSPVVSALLAASISLVLQWAFESRLRRQVGKSINIYFKVGLFFSHSILVVIWAATNNWFKREVPDPIRRPDFWELAIDPNVFNMIDDEKFVLLAFVPGVSFLFTAAVMILLRVVGNSPALERALVKLRSTGFCVPLVARYSNRPSTEPDGRRNAVDRIVGRMIAAAAICLAVDLMWYMACSIEPEHITGTATAGTFGALLFGKLRNWMFQALQPGEKNKWMAFLKPLIPQLLAYGTLVIFAVLTARLLIYAWDFQNFRFTASEGVRIHWAFVSGLVAVVILLGTLFLFDPVTIGMHAYYRGRITRAYLGASNRDPALDRRTDEQSKDDVLLRRLKFRPIHLVCCAANNLAGDDLATLNRGAQSYVASPLGLSMGKSSAEPPADLKLGSFLTASAAAFNSNMGSVSTRLGPAAAFLMSAMNLRLGLWVPNPCHVPPNSPTPMQRLKYRLEDRAPGFFFFEEMFGVTNSGAESKYVHISDGAHFENLGLYELVRRHCRYIIVSDCGADPELLFDDFGNASRRIREDFGVEFDIDLSPLKSENGRPAKQHMVVGTINYDSGNDCDKGILLYFKPNMTGDEPVDVEQYYQRNTAFPNESTGDQFYDEAQWEAYRRLGAHAARSALRFLQTCDKDVLDKASDVFRLARLEWYPTPDGLEDAALRQSSNYTALEDKLRGSGAAELVREFFPELTHLDLPILESAAPTIARTQIALQLLLDVVQFMEDTWAKCRLGTDRTHPLNVGWINLFQRWANAATLRMWWPIVRAMFHPQFRDFVERDLNVLGKEGTAPSPAPFDYRYSLRKLEKNDAGGLAWNWFTNLNPHWTPSKSTEAYGLYLDLPAKSIGKKETESVRLQVSLAIVEIDLAEATARWENRNFFIPPSLWANKFGRQMLDLLLKELEKRKEIEWCVVEVDSRPGDAVKTASQQENRISRTDAASRAATMDDITFYKSFGFYQPDKNSTFMERPFRRSEETAPGNAPG